jgi:hypothetical protein
MQHIPSRYVVCTQEPLALLQGWVHDFTALQLKHSPATLTSLVKVRHVSRFTCCAFARDAGDRRVALAAGSSLSASAALASQYRQPLLTCTGVRRPERDKGGGNTAAAGWRLGNWRILHPCSAGARLRCRPVGCCPHLRHARNRQRRGVFSTRSRLEESRKDACRADTSVMNTVHGQ